MNNIEKVNTVLNKMDGLAIIHELNFIEIKPEQNTLFITGAINAELFTCKAKEYHVFADPELSIIL